MLNALRYSICLQNRLHKHQVLGLYSVTGLCCLCYLYVRRIIAFINEKNLQLPQL